MKNNLNAVVLIYLHRLISSQRGSVYLYLIHTFAIHVGSGTRNNVKYFIHFYNNSTEILQNLFFTTFYLQLLPMRLMEGAPNQFGSKRGGGRLVMMS